MRRLPLIPLVLALAVVAGWSAVAPAPADANGCYLRFLQGTTGTAEDPILIPDRAALTELATSSACFASSYVFKQTADIDLSGGAWTPIAAGSSFIGTYDGAGHRITGLDVSRSTGNVGLFSALGTSTVRDLTISGGRVVRTTGTGSANAGALAGIADNSTITRVHAVGTAVAGMTHVGGLIGQTCSGSVQSSSASGAITGDAAVGGLIGSAASACVVSLADAGTTVAPATVAVADSSATGPVTGANVVGGLIGEAYGVTVERSFATGAVTASGEEAGGLVGNAADGYGMLTVAPTTVLTDVYATGSVRSVGSAGGLVAVVDSGVQITRAYATGRVTGAASTGGLVGGPYAPPCPGSEIFVCSVGVTAAAAATSFWDSATTGQSTSHGGFGTARSTAEMQSLATYTAAGWPIARGFSSAAGTTWGICPSANGGYPFLQNRYTASTPPCAGTPGKPRKVRMTAGDRSVTVSWEAPAADGGTPVTAYTATARMQKESGRAAPSCTVTAADTSCTITGLRNGRAYRVTLTADNIEGAGTATARTVTPSVGLVVLSTRRSGLAVVTRVRVRGAGRLTQVGRVAGVAGAVCRTSARPTKAGVVELRCALRARAEAALAGRDLAVRVTTTFRPSGGTLRTATRTVAFARTADADVVTG